MRAREPACHAMGCLRRGGQSIRSATPDVRYRRPRPCPTPDRCRTTHAPSKSPPVLRWPRLSVWGKVASSNQASLEKVAWWNRARQEKVALWNRASPEKVTPWNQASPEKVAPENWAPPEKVVSAKLAPMTDPPKSDRGLIVAELLDGLGIGLGDLL